MRVVSRLFFTLRSVTTQWRKSYSQWRKGSHRGSKDMDNETMSANGEGGKSYQSHLPLLTHQTKGKPLKMGIADTLSSTMEALVQQRRDLDKEGELELRVGQLKEDGSRFVPGVTAETFAQLAMEMEVTPALCADKEWRQVVDYHYVLPTGEHVRTRVECDTQGFSLQTSHVVKESVCSAVLREEEKEEGTDEAHSSSSQKVACRIDCSKEHVLATPPTSCLPTHVRLKHRRQFRDRRGDGTVWLYELSRTWSGPTRVAVDHLQRTKQPVYEVECELLDEHSQYMTDHDNAHIVHSLLLKSQMLMDTEAPVTLQPSLTLFKHKRAPRNGKRQKVTSTPHEG